MPLKYFTGTLRRFSDVRRCSRAGHRFSHSQALEKNAAQPSELPDRMSAWQVVSYGEENNLQFATDVQVPIIEDPNQVLVNVAAASVNPLDVAMLRGYGSVLLNNLRHVETLCQKSTPELPLVLGRDFAGTVAGRGTSVTEFDIGDEVYGVIKPQNQGCHREFAITDQKLLARKPESISMEEASGVLYTTLTAWSALKISGNLILWPPKGKRVLVLGASGGVGNAAVQLLNAWDATVIATCQTDAIPLVQKLSPELILDYTSPSHLDDVQQAGSYDVILDAAGLTEKELEKYVSFVNSCGSVITLRTPLLSNIDNHGLLYGSVKSAIDLVLPNLRTGVLKKGGLIKWAYFVPCETAVKEIASLVAANKLLPPIDKIYPYSETPDAYNRMKASHLRGKVVISMNAENISESSGH